MKNRILILTALVMILSLLWAIPVTARELADNGLDAPPVAFDPEDEDDELGEREDPDEDLLDRDADTDDMEIGPGPYDDDVEALLLGARGIRLLSDATTDVWAHEGFAYVGTFNNPCGDGTGANGSGIRIFDVRDVDELDDGDDEGGMIPVEVPEVGVIPSVLGSRSNDVKVAEMNSGDILVHSNEPCAGGGQGGFEIYNVDDPTNPVHKAHVQTDDINAFLRDDLGFVDFGVHNLFLFRQDARDYVAAVVESEFGNFQIFDITDPESPGLVGSWGAEELRLAELGLDPSVVPGLTDFDLILQLDAWLFSGYGSSQNRFLHDITISTIDDGDDDDDDNGDRVTRAYLSNWDAGLVLLDISDPTDPTLVSVALDPENGSLDGEVNSHAAWPSEDGRVVVETEEDFAPFVLTFAITEGPNAGRYPAAEAGFTVPLLTLPGGEMSGPTTYVGLACTGGDPVPASTGPGQIAVIQRGACRFDEKAQNVIGGGYEGMVVFNDAARGDALITMGGDPRAIPGVFVGHSTGLAIFDVASAGDLTIGDPGAAIAATAEPEAWGGVRIWDYSDPENPVLVSTFNTVCSANPGDPSCDPRGTYTAHNVVVEDDKAYLSWYADGVLILDIDDPSNPVEVGRFHREGPEFELQNGGIQDVWGIYKIPDEESIFASDRNGGLYVLVGDE